MQISLCPPTAWHNREWHWTDSSGHMGAWSLNHMVPAVLWRELYPLWSLEDHRGLGEAWYRPSHVCSDTYQCITTLCIRVSWPQVTLSE